MAGGQDEYGNQQGETGGRRRQSTGRFNCAAMLP
ncbi:unnamed protein product [Ectocarpus sp. CCAP 1310/34]|nr:unnamed protein product [Ectocarpus sp. CCAP 1310/34]